MRAPLTPEHELLFHLLRLETDGQVSNTEDNASWKLDWVQVVDLVTSHGVAPYVVSRSTVADVEMPEIVSDVLARAAFDHAEGALAQAAHLIALTRELESVGIASIALKGPVLAWRAYGDLGLRETGDVDVLVAPGDVDSTVAQLVNHGYQLVLRYTSDSPECAAYREVAADLRLGAGRRTDASLARHRPSAVVTNWQSFLRFSNELSWYHPDRGSLDLHWRLFKNSWLFPFDPWSHRSTVVHNGTRIGILEPEVDLLYLATHGAKHAWSRMKWLLDLPMLIRAEGLDLAVLAELARRSGLDAVVGSALRLSACYLGYPDSRLVDSLLPEDRLARSLRLSSQSALLATRGTMAQRVGASRHHRFGFLRHQLGMRRGTRYRARVVEDYLAPANWRIELGSPIMRPLRIARCMLDFRLGQTALLEHGHH